MESRLTYAIRYVADMDKAVAFFRDTMGLTLRFQSPGWSEFATGDVTLALHLATKDEPAGTTELGFRTASVAKEFAEARLAFVEAPRAVHGSTIARFRDIDGAACSLSS